MPLTLHCNKVNQGRTDKRKYTDIIKNKMLKKKGYIVSSLVVKAEGRHTCTALSSGSSCELGESTVVCDMPLLVDTQNGLRSFFFLMTGY